MPPFCYVNCLFQIIALLIKLSFLIEFCPGIRNPFPIIIERISKWYAFVFLDITIVGLYLELPHTFILGDLPSLNAIDCAIVPILGQFLELLFPSKS